MKFNVAMKQFKLNTFILLWVRFVKSREVKAFSTDWKKKRKKEKEFNVGLHSDSYETILFKLGMMIDTTEIYILIQVWDLI